MKTERVQAQCSSCQAPIFWVRTSATDSLIPIDWNPVDNGNIMIDEDGRALYRNKTTLFDPAVNAGERYVSHFATCVNAKHHRKAK